MAIQGLVATNDFGGTIAQPDTIPAHERPTNWRQGILMRFPNGHAPLVALTSVMKKKVTDDPQYQWWERELSDVRLSLDTAIHTPTLAPGTTTITFAANPFGHGGVDQVKPGDLLRSEHEESGNYEIMRVLTVTPGANQVTVTRGFAGTTAFTYTVASESVNFHIMGSVYEEGADTPESIRYRPVKKYNYTQIFRDSLKATRTAMHTRLRTVDEVRDAKQQALLYHSIRMEYAFWFGARSEAIGAGGEPERTTGGIIQTIRNEAAANVLNQAGAAMSLAEFEDMALEAFRWGSQEKMGFCGNRALLAIQRLVRKNASLEITPAVKEFGMDVRRLFTPYGTLVLKTHPLFNQITSTVASSYWSLDSWLVILDMANLTYRPLKNSDTQYLPDRQNNGRDALTSEYLTEAGLEVAHAKTHFVVKGLVAGEADA